MANSAEELIKFYKDESSFAHLEGAWRALCRWMGPCRTCTCMYGDKSNLTRSFLNPSTGAATLENEGVTGLEAIKGKIERLNLPGVVVNFGSVDVQSSIDGACALWGTSKQLTWTWFVWLNRSIFPDFQAASSSW